MLTCHILTIFTYDESHELTQVFKNKLSLCFYVSISQLQALTKVMIILILEQS